MTLTDDLELTIATVPKVHEMVITPRLRGFARVCFSSGPPMVLTGTEHRELKRGSSKITNVSISDSNPPIQILTTAYGEGDPGYLNTGRGFNKQ